MIMGMMYVSYICLHGPSKYLFRACKNEVGISHFIFVVCAFISDLYTKVIIIILLDYYAI